MNALLIIAAVPFGIGWQEIMLIFLIIAILAGPGFIAIAIVLLILRHQRRKRGGPPPIPR
ncbi:hypothetical protein BH18VER1_BH18VER1_20340 [soil metagenome]